MNLKLLRNILKLTIRTKLVTFISFLIGIICLFILLYFPSRIEKQATKSIIEKAESIAEMTSFSVSPALFFEDIETIEEVFQSAKQNKDLIYIVVTNNSLDIVTAFNKDKAEQSNFINISSNNRISANGMIYNTVTPILYNNRQIGKLYIGLSLENLQKELAKTRTAITLVSLIIFIIGVSIAFGISTIITSPLSQMVKTFEHISIGDLTRRAQVLSNDEIGNLAVSFNRMVDNLEAFQHKLKTVNIQLKRQAEELQNEVNERKWAEEQMRASLEEKDIILKELEEYKSELEEKVEERTKKLEEQKIELEKTLKELQDTHLQLLHSEKMASLGQMVAGVAHEINNPIGYIYANIKFLEDYVNRFKKLLYEYENIIHILETEADKSKILNLKSKISNLKSEIDYEYIIKDIDSLLKSCNEGSQRVKNIVTDLRNFSRLDEAELKEVDIHSGIESTLTLFLHQYQDKIIVHKEYGDIPKIKCYASQLNQVFMNLLTNAAHTIEEKNKIEQRFKGNIWIKTEKVMRNEKLENSIPNSEIVNPKLEIIRILIKDDGTGISEEIKDKLFDPFFTTKPVGKGTGLGLSISYSIIEKHKGKLFFNTEIGKGTEFIIELPIEIN
jgi:signal transduction histidine kinase